jgi:hypothetical protein
MSVSWSVQKTQGIAGLGSRGQLGKNGQGKYKQKWITIPGSRKKGKKEARSIAMTSL